VSNISFSPCERFLISVNDSEIGRRVSIWNINTGEEKRRFTGEQSSWNDFKWSYDGSFILKKG